jgi:hypothetical protein
MVSKRRDCEHPAHMLPALKRRLLHLVGRDQNGTLRETTRVRRQS